MNAADDSIKPLTGPIHERHWSFSRGLRFYPSDDTPHGKYVKPPLSKPYTYTTIASESHIYHNMYCRTMTTTIE